MQSCCRATRLWAQDVGARAWPRRGLSQDPWPGRGCVEPGRWAPRLRGPCVQGHPQPHAQEQSCGPVEQQTTHLAEIELLLRGLLVSGG